MGLGGSVKGWFGEAGLSLARRWALDEATYRSLNDVTVRVASGTTQIDHIIVSRYGIFVVETKSMKGWIFGNEKSPKWTQSIFGRNYTFQNPLHQNFRHIKVLCELLELPISSFHSVVCFVDRRCKFKTPMPGNVIRGMPFDYIRSKTAVLLSDDKVAAVAEAISAAAIEPTTFWGWLTGATRREHRKSLRQRHGSKTTCPKCGGRLVLRSANRGARRCARFYGCDRYPNCMYTRNAG